MTAAFNGDAAIKADLFARLCRHAEAGTLRFGATCWNGTGGSPLGVSIEGEDSAVYAERFGYPLALAGLLDPVTAWADPSTAVATTLEWVSCVEPGVDLAGVPWNIVDDLLVQLGADRFATPQYAALAAVHRREAAGGSLERREWSALRGEIEAAAAIATGAQAAALDACAIACWPLATSRSVLVELFGWRHRHASQWLDPDFGETERQRAHAMLEAIRVETQIDGQKTPVTSIPAIFRARASDLATRFESNLMRTNLLVAEHRRQASLIVLRHLAAVVRQDEYHQTTREVR